MTYSLAIGDKTYSSWSLRGWLLFAKFDIPVDVVTARMYAPEFVEMLKSFGGGRLVPAVRFDTPNGAGIVSDTLAIAETLAEGPVAWIQHWLGSALTHRCGQATTSNLARPSSFILLRMLVPILTSVFWFGRFRAFSLGPMTVFQRPICASPRLR